MQDKLKGVIATERLRIREITEADAEKIVAWRNKESVYRYFKNPHKITIEEHLKWYNNIYLNQANRIDCMIELCSENDNKAIGTCGILAIDIDNNKVEISYLLDENYQGRGYASEAVLAVEQYVKDALDIHNVLAVIHKDNQVSIDFAVRLGYSKKSITEEFYEYEKKI